MHWVEKPGTSLDAMRRITVRASQELRAIPGVRNFGSHIGRAEVADEVVGANFTELWISLDPTSTTKPTVAKIQAVVDGYPGLTRDLLTYLRERIKEVLTGASATIVVRIFGPDLTELGVKAGEVAQGALGHQRRRRSHPAAADPGAAGPGAHAAGARADGRRDAAAHPRDRRHGPAGHARSARSTISRRSSTSSSGACRRCASDLFAIKRLPIDTGGGRLRPAGGGRRRLARADAQRDHARRRIAPHRRDDAT